MAGSPKAAWLIGCHARQVDSRDSYSISRLANERPSRDAQRGLVCVDNREDGRAGSDGVTERPRGAVYVGTDTFVGRVGGDPDSHAQMQRRMTDLGISSPP